MQSNNLRLVHLLLGLAVLWISGCTTGSDASQPSGSSPAVQRSQYSSPPGRYYGGGGGGGYTGIGP